MMSKLADILEQFEREIISAQEAFDRCKAAPPLTRNQPPVAGARGEQWGQAGGDGMKHGLDACAAAPRACCARGRDVFQ